MNITYITTLDGRTRIEWWERENFQDRSTELYAADSAQDLLNGKNLELVDSIPIPDHVVVCDFCNAKIGEYPVPVMRGSYALCTVCYERIKEEGGESNGHDVV